MGIYDQGARSIWDGLSQFAEYKSKLINAEVKGKYF